jgi:hypothetical protein
LKLIIHEYIYSWSTGLQYLEMSVVLYNSLWNEHITRWLSTSGQLW